MAGEMAALGVEDVKAILDERAWSPRQLDEHTLRCTLESEAGEIRLVVRHAGPWLYLAVLPFLDAAGLKPWGGGKFPPRFLGRILAVNYNLTLVKFALDDDGDLTLRAELPTESMQRGEVEVALDLLVGVTQQYRIPVRDALLDAGRATERPSLLPPAPASHPPLASDEPIDHGPSIEAHEPKVDLASDPLPREP
ncbi:MAG: YbjN domain-containing protein [Myxococcales bacterium]|nr:YbjN domain-containing protein [Myxococcales bacterium]